MILLTVRSSRDGRLLARIVEKDGHPFVLDVGERRVIDDATQRISKGFTMFRMGGLVTASPQSVDMLSLLAEFYASEGGLVAFDEPDWAGRLAADNLPLGGATALLRDPEGAPDFSDDETDYAALPPSPPAAQRSIRHAVPLRLSPLPDDFGDDPPTELAGPIKQPLPAPRPPPVRKG